MLSYRHNGEKASNDMTDSEAVKRLYRNAYRTTCYGNKVVEHEENLIAIQALEKRIPKKPTYEGDGYAPDVSFVWDEWLCPCCGKRYEVDYDDYDYCPNCGQKIDWSDK